MIKSLKDYKEYVKKDELMSNGNVSGHKFLYLGEDIKKYLRILRKREYLFYLRNERKVKFLKIYDLFLQYRMHNLGIKLGFSIPLNTVGEGFRIDHYGGGNDKSRS